MMLEKKLIGKDYDKEIFEDGFRRSARAITKETHNDPDSSAGLALQEAFINRMRTGLEKTPVEYYQLLEAFAGNEPVEGLASGEFVSRWKDAGDIRLVKLMMDMNEEFQERQLKITNLEASIAYHSAKFPQRIRLKLNLKKERNEPKASAKPKNKAKKKELSIER